MVEKKSANKKKKDIRKTKRLRGRKDYQCSLCKSTHSILAKYGLVICRKCFRDVGEQIGFRKY